MAEVYLAEPIDGQGPPQVAIKRLLPHYATDRRFVDMMRDEAHIAQAIHHPNVTRVFEVGETDGYPYIVMEYVDGVDLGRVLRAYHRSGQHMPIPVALFCAQQVALGLSAAHALVDAFGRSLEVVHRDVSPHNVLVGREGNVKLIDFGVAKAASNSSHTRTGVIKGKLQYMSPEQALAKKLDPRADVFSLGMTLYKLLTGRLPFEGANEYQIYDQILRAEARTPRCFRPEIPARVEAITLRALRKPLETRLQSAQQMADLLAFALSEIAPDYQERDLAQDLVRLLANYEKYAHDTSAEDALLDVEPLDIEAPSETQISMLSRLPGDLPIARQTRIARPERPASRSGWGAGVQQIEASSPPAAADLQLPPTQALRVASGERRVPSAERRLASTPPPVFAEPTLAQEASAGEYFESYEGARPTTALPTVHPGYGPSEEEDDFLSEADETLAVRPSLPAAIPVSRLITPNELELPAAPSDPSLPAAELTDYSVPAEARGQGVPKGLIFSAILGLAAAIVVSVWWLMQPGDSSPQITQGPFAATQPATQTVTIQALPHNDLGLVRAQNEAEQRAQGPSGAGAAQGQSDAGAAGAQAGEGEAQAAQGRPTDSLDAAGSAQPSAPADAAPSAQPLPAQVASAAPEKPRRGGAAANGSARGGAPSPREPAGAREGAAASTAKSRPAAAPPAPRASAQQGGFLTVNALPWAHVEVNGRRLPATTPILEEPLRPGRYKVRLISPTGEVFEKSVQIKGGETQRVIHRF